MNFAQHSNQNEKSPAVKSLLKEKEKQQQEEAKMTAEEKLERGLKDTFPASDPVAVASPTIKSGEPGDLTKKPISKD